MDGLHGDDLVDGIVRDLHGVWFGFRLRIGGWLRVVWNEARFFGLWANLEAIGSRGDALLWSCVLAVLGLGLRFRNATDIIPGCAQFFH